MFWAHVLKSRQAFMNTVLKVKKKKKMSYKMASHKKGILKCLAKKKLEGQKENVTQLMLKSQSPKKEYGY